MSGGSIWIFSSILGLKIDLEVRVNSVEGPEELGSVSLGVGLSTFCGEEAEPGDRL